MFINKLFSKQSHAITFGIIFILIISLVLNYLVFRKSAPNFPVILRINDFGSNFLTNRYSLWQTPALGIILIVLNYLLSRALQKSHQRLSFLLNSVNIGITVIMLLISLQIYILNR